MIKIIKLLNIIGIRIKSLKIWKWHIRGKKNKEQKLKRQKNKDRKLKEIKMFRAIEEKKKKIRFIPMLKYW